MFTAELRCEFLSDANPRFLVVMFSIASELPAKNKRLQCRQGRKRYGCTPGHRLNLEAGCCSPVVAPGLQARPGWAPALSASLTSLEHFRSPSPAHFSASQSEMHHCKGKKSQSLEPMPPPQLCCPGTTQPTLSPHNFPADSCG